jgi:hypothetical protein
VTSRLISLEALERVRAQQAGEAKAVSAHTARSHLGGVLEKRADVLASQDLCPSGCNRGGRGGKRSATDPAGRASEHR